MLPVDEEVFDINANTREITVPSLFKTYGISVKGDEFAEIIYFRIDRFFDAMDLDTADIYIQWTTSSGISGISMPWVVDIVSEPNKIIFGWALSSNITQATGALKFAIRFVKWSDDSKTKIAYSWSSLAQSAAIKDSLDFTLGGGDYIEELDSDALIIGRIQSCITNVTNREDAVEPIWVLNLPNIADLALNEEGKETYTLKVQANSTDGGIVSYYWKEANNAQRLENSDDVQIDIVFEATKDEEPLNKIYYIAEATDGVTAYKQYDVSNLNTDLDETPASKGLFEKIAICTISNIGAYSAGAINSKTGHNSTAVESNICVIPTPVEPTIEKDIQTSAIVEKNSAYSTVLEVVASNEETNGSQNGKLTCQWYKNADAISDEQAENIYLRDEWNEETQESKLTPYLPIEGAEDFNLAIEFDEDLAPSDVEGTYMAVVTNYKNKTPVTKETSVCRVSYPAEAPVLSYPIILSENESGVVGIRFDDPISMAGVRVEIDADWLALNNISDNLTYQWFKTNAVQDSDEETENDTEDELIEGANSFKYVPTEIGRRYYCKVTNHKNGTSAFVLSPEFSVTR